MILQSIMAGRAEVAAEAVNKGLGTLRLQEKLNCVRQYEAFGAKREDFCKEWNRSSGKILQEQILRREFEFPRRRNP